MKRLAVLLVALSWAAVAAPARRKVPAPPAAPVPASTPPAKPSAAAPAPDAGVPPVRPLSFERHATPQQVKLGEPFLYEVVFTHLPTQRYELRTPKDLGAFELEETSRSREDGPAQSKTTFRLKLALFELGTKQVPDVTFDVVTPEGVHAFVVPGVEVEGLSSLPKDADAKGASLADIKPPEDVPQRSYRLLWVALAVVAAAALAYALVRYLMRPRPVKAAPAEPPLPVDVRARKALEALAREGLPAQGRGRELFFRLSEILRGYLGERYGFEALECTSAELLSRAEALQARELPYSELRHFVLESDFVKFAKREPSFEDCDEALAFGHLLVDRTAPSRLPPPDARNASGPVLP